MWSSWSPSSSSRWSSSEKCAVGREGSRLICVSAAASDAMLSDRLLCSHHQDEEHTGDHHHADDDDHVDDDHAADGDDNDYDWMKIIFFNLILPKCWWRRVLRRSLARDCIAAQIFQSAFTIDAILERIIFGDNVVIWWEKMRQDKHDCHLSDLLSFVLTLS